MNVFFLHDDPREAARMLGDKHVGKMLLESAQMLFTAVRKHGFDGGGYKSAYENHPMTVWVGQSYDHARWVLEHALELAHEFEYRYGHAHKTTQRLPTLSLAVHNYMPDNGWRNPPRCIPNEYKRDYATHVGPESCHVASYRDYYAHDKRHLHTYTRRHAPDWLGVAA